MPWNYALFAFLITAAFPETCHRIESCCGQFICGGHCKWRDCTFLEHMSLRSHCHCIINVFQPDQDSLRMVLYGEIGEH